jgi:mycothiol synthase
MTVRSRAIDLRPVAVPEWTAALELLHRALPDAHERVLFDLRKLHQQPDLARGLWAYWKADELLGVIWLEAQPGRIVYVHPPQIVDQQGLTTDWIAQALCAAAERELVSQNHYWLQTLIDPAQGKGAVSLLERCGYRRLSMLSYQVCPAERFPKSHPRLRWLPERVVESELASLADLVQQTYRGSLDCPELDHDRPVLDVLDGYRQVGVSGLKHWWFAEQNHHPLACQLMTLHPEASRANHQQHFAEVIYWGIVPERRGEGLGLELMHWAQWQAAQVHACKLVLAVDTRNRPALTIYDRAGFWEWTRREVWVKNLWDERSTQPSASEFYDLP